MSNQEKKVLFLLLLLTFHQDQMDEEEIIELHRLVEVHQGQEAIAWATSFLSLHHHHHYQKVTRFIFEQSHMMNQETKLNLLHAVWMANLNKGYISEIEATLLLNCSKNWGVQKDFVLLVKELSTVS